MDPNGPLPDFLETGGTGPPEIPGFSITGILGGGSFGRVYRAHEETLDRTVALKVVRRSARQKDAVLKQFLREARALARLEHENVVRVYSASAEDDSHYICMELIDGKTIKEILRERQLSRPEALAIARDLARALQCVHAADLVHCDLKPSNVMIDSRGVVKLMDFGVSRFDDMTSEDTRRRLATAGTPSYMAPERLRGNIPDARADLFSLGVLLYQMLTGELPFHGDNVSDVVTRILRDDRVEILDQDPTLPEAIATIVDRLLAHDPAQRHASAAEVEAELDEILEATSPSRSSTAAARLSSLVGGADNTASAAASAANDPEPAQLADPASAGSRHTPPPRRHHGTAVMIGFLAVVLSVVTVAFAMYIKHSDTRTEWKNRTEGGADADAATADVQTDPASLDPASVDSTDHANAGTASVDGADRANAGTASVDSDRSGWTRGGAPDNSAISKEARSGPAANATTKSTPDEAVPTSAAAPLEFRALAEFCRLDSRGDCSVKLYGDDKVENYSLIRLRFWSDQPVWVYIWNESSDGKTYQLFPIEGGDLDNPLDADTEFYLPGSRNEVKLDWKLDDEPGKQVFWVHASSRRSEQIESLLIQMLQPASEGADDSPRTYARAKAKLGRLTRGAAIVAETPVADAPDPENWGKPMQSDKGMLNWKLVFSQVEHTDKK